MASAVSAIKEDELAKYQCQDKKCCHSDGVDFSKVCDSDNNPQNDQCSDYQTPDPASGM